MKQFLIQKSNYCSNILEYYYITAYTIFNDFVNKKGVTQLSIDTDIESGEFLS